MFVEYFVVFLILIVLEGLLSADNALVLAILVKPLPEYSQKKALLYGLLGAFVLRFTALFFISYLANIWEAQAIGAIYLLYIAVKNLLPQKEDKPKPNQSQVKFPSFWGTVARVELTDIAFAIDSDFSRRRYGDFPAAYRLGTHRRIGQRYLFSNFLRRFRRLDHHALCRDDLYQTFAETPRLRKSRLFDRRLGRCEISHYHLSAPVVRNHPASVPGSLAFKLIFFAVMFALAAWGWFQGENKEKIEE